MTEFCALDWTDLDTDEPVFGAQAHPIDVPASSPITWFHVYVNGEPLAFKLKAERDAWLSDANKHGCVL